MRLSRIIITALSLLVTVSAGADEGLWQIQDLKGSVEKNMRAAGLKMPVHKIYDMDNPGRGVADAAVSFGFKYSGSVVSYRGLVLTVYAPAEAYLEKRGDAGRTLLDNGFWAGTDNLEIPMQGEKVYSLIKVLDITEGLKASIKRLGSEEKAVSEMEKSYTETSGLTCKVTSSWGGEKYYLSAYKVYDDVRLVAIPPRSVARMGVDAEKWEWPAVRGDFALFRLYENGKPVSGLRSLEVSMDGYSEGSFAMSVGFPGSTMRFSSSASTQFREKHVLPLTTGLRSQRLDILQRNMKGNPSLKAKYSDRAEELEDWLLYARGESNSYKKYRLGRAKGASEAGLPDDLVKSLNDAVAGMETAEVDKIRRQETIQDGTYIGSYLRRAAAAGSLERAKEILLKGVSETDPDVEKELLACSLEDYFTNLDNFYYGPYQRWIQNRFGYDYKAAAEYLWNHSLVSSSASINDMEDLSSMSEDALWKFLSDSPLSLYDGGYGKQSGQYDISGLEEEYKRSLYEAAVLKGEPVYPDANSTLRLSYGRVGGFYPSDGVYCSGYTIPSGMLQRNASDSGYALDARFKSVIEKDFWGRWGFRTDGRKHGMRVEFLSDLDYVEGCEGAPVLDSEGRLIGVVSGGNQEALGGRVAYHDYYSKCVSTDIRFILWFLDRYAGIRGVVKEFECI